MPALTFDAAYLIRSASAAEIFFCVIFYTLPYRRRNGFPLRLAAMLLGGMAVLIPLTHVYLNFPGVLANILVMFAVYAYHLLLLWVLFRESLSELLLTVCAGMATQILIGKLFETLYIILGKNPYQSLSLFPDGTLPMELDWAIYYALHFLLALAFALFFRRKRVYSHGNFYTKVIIIFSLSTTVITTILSNYSRPLEPENLQLAVVIRSFSALFALCVLILRTGILEQSRMSEELRTTEELLHAEKKQFENIRSDMEIINMKCHDIRHQLSRYAGKLTEGELESLRAAIQIYDASLKTGSDILDMILYKRQGFCQENHIQITCIADGECLSFLSPSDQYSLFNNALENAIEAVLKLPDPEMRIISLTVEQKSGLVSIHVTNYFNQSCTIEDGLPQTTNEDVQHHGYGTKSLRYIVQQYGGKISFETEDNIFYLHILLPEQADAPV